MDQFDVFVVHREADEQVGTVHVESVRWICLVLVWLLGANCFGAVGDFDLRFGTMGYAWNVPLSGSGVATAEITVDEQDRILIADRCDTTAFVWSDLCVGRLTPDGMTDKSFGN